MSEEAKPKVVRHVKRFPKRTCIVTFTEYKDHIKISVVMSKYGCLGDELEFGKWFFSLMQAYDSDPRPHVMENQHSGERAILTDSCTLVIAEKPPNN